MKFLKLIFLLLIFSSFSFAQTNNDEQGESLKNYPAPSFKGPRDTFFYFIKTMKGYKLGDKEALPLAIKALDLSKFDPQTRVFSGQTAAVKLINTIDRLEYVKFDQIPNSLEDKKWIFKKELIPTEKGDIFAEISVTKMEDGRWLFSSETLEKIASYERYVKDRNVVSGVKELKDWKERIKAKMPNWMGSKSFILLNGQWIALLFLIFFGFLCDRILRMVLLSIIVKALARKGIKVSEQLHRKLATPLGIIVFTLFWNLGVRFLEFNDGLLSWLLRGGQVLFTIACVLAFYQLVDYLCLYLEKKAYESENKFDDILIPLIRKSAKTFVIAVGIIAVGDSLTLDMKGLLAGMGIAGLGVSLAAKDTISNLFGSLTVLLDRPFRIGDWVKIDGNIEGMVEEVGLRSCRIRTFHNSLITIPNGMLTNAHIDNLGMRQYRRLSIMISV